MVTITQKKYFLIVSGTGGLPSKEKTNNSIEIVILTFASHHNNHCMKHCLFLLFFFFGTFVTAQTGQTDSLAMNRAQQQGNVMAKLLLAKDYKAFAKYTYQPVIDISGGEDKMVALIQQSIDQLQNQGYSFTNFTIEKPLQLIHFNNTLQCTITEIIEMKVPSGQLTSKASLIGISGDNGQNWTFIDTHGSDLPSLQKQVPGLSDGLQIPEQQQPVLEKN